MNLYGGMFRLWAVASLIWISFVFIVAYQQISSLRQVSIAAYTGYATLAVAPVCGTFAILFISGWIVAGFIRPH
ncbi:MAG: hypothetical protein WA837_03405 [Xanthobacteraceae bacterium]